MGTEIERKFIVTSQEYKQTSAGVLYMQGYLSTDPARTVRVRIANNKGYLTIKGISTGSLRQEYEYEIPVQDAQQMLESLCTGPIIEKYRYKVSYNGFIWDIDEFYGENEGLVLAEIELEYENQLFEKPYWIGCEVTGDIRYYNSYLVQNPYVSWKD